MCRYPSIESVAKHGDHSENSWRDIAKIREELKKDDFKFPKLKSAYGTKESSMEQTR